MPPLRIVIQPVPGDEAGAWVVRSPGNETRYGSRTDAIRAARNDANRRLTGGFDSQLVVLDGDGGIDHVESFTKVSAGCTVSRRCARAPRSSAA